jgi:glutathione S-transferase
MALSYLNISIELREILLKDRPKQLLKISPKGTVPVLQLVNGDVIEESIDIMNWAIEISNNEDLIHINPKLQFELIDQNDTIFKIWLDRYKYNNQNQKYSYSQCRKKCDKVLIQYEKLLINNDYLMNNSISFCDMAIFPFIRQFYNIDINYFSNTYPKLNFWLQKIINSVLFKSVMIKYPQWESNDNSKIINLKEVIESFDKPCA